MTRLIVVTTALITLTAATIGASNLTQFQLGKAPLDNRSKYCEWMRANQSPAESDQLYQPIVKDAVLFPALKFEAHDHIWNLGRRLAPYRSQAIVFDHIPDSVLAEIKNQSLHKLERQRYVRSSIQLLERQKEGQARKKESKVEKIEEQIQALKEENKKLEKEIKKLSEKRFTDWEIFHLLQAAYESGSKTEDLPSLALQLELHDEWLRRRIEVYPVWLLPNQKRVRASQTPYYEISGSMVSEELISALNKNDLPETFSLYYRLSRLPQVKLLKRQPSGHSTQQRRRHALIEFVDSNKVLIQGTPYSNRAPESLFSLPAQSHFTSASNFAVDAILDLGCLKDSEWALELIEKNHKVLFSEKKKQKWEYEKVDPQSLELLAVLESINPRAQKVEWKKVQAKTSPANDKE